MSDERRYHDIVFILFLVTVPLLSLPFHHGISIFDPAYYIKSANFLLQGRWMVEENFYANRIASCLPYSLGMFFFGVSDYLTFITTIELMALLALIYFVIGKYNKDVALVSVLLLGTSQIVLKSASAINSDMMIALTANAVVLIWFYFRKQNLSTGKSIAAGVLMGVMFGIAFLSKESIAFYTPLLLYLAIKDFRQRTMRKFWLGAGLTVSFFAGAVLLYYAIKTGDPLYRITAVETGPSTSEVNYTQAGFGEIFARCTYEPLQFIMRDLTFAVLFIFSVLHLFMPSRSEEQNAVKKYFLFTIIFWWFGSQSFSTWNPVGLVHRLWLPLLVPMALNSAYVIRDVTLESLDMTVRQRVKYSVTLLIMTLTGWIAFYASFLQYESINRSDFEFAQLLSNILWISVLVVIALFFIWMKNAQPKTLLYKAMILLAILFPAINEIHLSEVWYWVDKEHRPINEFQAERNIVAELEKLHPKIILAEPALSDNYGIYVGFDKTLPFVDFTNIQLDSIPPDSYMLLNEKRMQYWKDNMTESTGFKMKKYEIPEFAYFPEKYGFVIIQQIAGCKLYQKRT